MREMIGPLCPGTRRRVIQHSRAKPNLDLAHREAGDRAVSITGLFQLLPPEYCQV